MRGMLLSAGSTPDVFCGELQNGPADSVKAIKGTTAKGMILPFQPMALTFHDVCYYVPLPKVHI